MYLPVLNASSKRRVEETIRCFDIWYVKALAKVAELKQNKERHQKYETYPINQNKYPEGIIIGSVTVNAIIDF